MQLRRVGVLGGGPGGLYAARLLKLARPACDVIVYEEGEPGTTFGWPPGPSGTWRPRIRTRCGISWPRDAGTT